MHLRFLLVALALPLSGCGLLLDTSPPDEPPDGGVECTTATECDDGIECTRDSCNSGVCKNAPDDTLCDEGVGDVCGPTIGCTKPCEADTGCDYLDLGECGQGHCTFIEDHGYCIRTFDDSICTDDVNCTEDVCSGVDGQCTNTPSDAACDDGLSCTVDACTTSGGSQDENGCVHTPDDAVCADDFACTTDVCAPGNELADDVKGCVNVPDDSVCGGTSGCATGVCTPALGCQFRYETQVCSELAHCVIVDNAGEWAGLCQALPTGCTEDSQCNDGNPCNGAEICDEAEGVCLIDSNETGCGAPTDPCLENFCEPLSDVEFACETRLLPECYDLALPVAN